MAGDDTQHDAHASHVGLYVKALIALLILTVVTVAAAQVDFGPWNLVVAMGIASVKATIVLLLFMHLTQENPLTWMYAMLPVVLLLLMLGGIFIDNPLRKTPVPPGPQTAPVRSGSTAGH